MNALTLFGKELPWELDTALFWLLVAQVALIMFLVIVFAVLIHRVGRDRTTVVIKEPKEEEENPIQFLEAEVIAEPEAESHSVEFPEELRGSWGIEGHDGIRVVIGLSTLSVDGVVATGIAETDTEGEYSFLLGDVEHTVFLKRARKHEEALTKTPAETAEDASKTADAETETHEMTEEAEAAADVEHSKEDDGNLRLINGGDYFYAKLYKWTEAVAPEAESEPLVITFPESLRSDWVVEGHESVHVLIEEHTLFIDGVEALDIALDPEKPTEYTFKANGLDYVVAYGTSDEGGFRNISGGEFDACALVEPVESEAESEQEEPLVITFPETLRGDWVVEGHEGVHVLIEEHALFVDGVEATDIALDPEKPTEYKLKANGIDYVVYYNSAEEDGYRAINGGAYEACALIEPAEEHAEEPVEEPVEDVPAEEPVAEIAEEPVEEAPVEEIIEEQPVEEPVIVAFPESLRGDWLVEGHEGVHVVIEEYTAQIDGIEARNISLDEEGNYLLTANETEYVIAYNTSDETPVRTIDGGNFETANLIEYVEPAEQPVEEEIVEEPVEEEPVAEIAEEPIEETPVEEPVEEPIEEIVEEQPVEEVVEEQTAEPPAETPASEHNGEFDFGDEETHEAGVLRYDRSFTARFIQSSDEIKSWYTKLKNEMLSYKKVKARMSWKRETFRFGRETVARLGYRGNTLCIFLPLDPAEYIDSRYKVEDVSDSPSYVDTPCMYRLKNDKRVRLAIELFATVMERLGAVRIERVSEDYYLPYEGIVELIERGLAKRVIKSKADEAIFTQGAPAEEAEAVADKEPTPEVKHEKPEIVDFGDEESFEGGILRYDRSFTARFIQSDDEIKSWYTKLKNELLSYKKVKARMSWNRETFRFGKETVARLGYRGNTLCIFLPLDPADYVDSRYKVEDVSDSPSYADTPCMYRLKNDKRVRLAIELFATVMERLGAVRIERVSEDYYLPYEGIVELIDKGLAKRVIKSKADEAIFTQGAPTEEAAADKEPTPTSELPNEEPQAEEKEQAEQSQTQTLAGPAESQQHEQDTTPAETEEQLPADEQPQEEQPQEEEQLPEEETQEQQTVEETPLEEDEAEPQQQSEPADGGEETEHGEEAEPVEEPAEDSAEQAEDIGETAEESEEPIEETGEPAEATEEPIEEQAEPASEIQSAEGEDVAEAAPQDESAELEKAEEETSEDETSEPDGEVDFSSGLSAERPRLNGKSRKKHKVRR